MGTTPVQSETPSAVRTDLGAIFVSLELSRSTWLVTSLSPGSGAEMSMTQMLTEINHGRMTPCDYVLMACEAPADAFRLRRKGRLAIGGDADIVLADMFTRGSISAAGLHSLGNTTPFEGFQTAGAPFRTLVRGASIAMGGHRSDSLAGGAGFRPKTAPHGGGVVERWVIGRPPRVTSGETAGNYRCRFRKGAA